MYYIGIHMHKTIYSIVYPKIKSLTTSHLHHLVFSASKYHKLPFKILNIPHPSRVNRGPPGGAPVINEL